ncbi:hypothetical protein HJ590_14645 [Naumannella sp. ID2617S]|nr:hypothetical protein [Naumannella sp. ID2617S]
MERERQRQQDRDHRHTWSDVTLYDQRWRELDKLVLDDGDLLQRILAGYARVELS